MQEGLSSVIEYTWTDGVARYAQFRNTDVSLAGSIIQNTGDPNWYVWHRDGSNNGEFEWLNYITLDGSLWRAKLHCRYVPQVFPLPLPNPADPHIEANFEHVPYPDGDGHDDVVINFLDWDRHPWQARLNRINPPFPAQPTFTLIRL
jgi:hypothetical protein